MHMKIRFEIFYKLHTHNNRTVLHQLMRSQLKKIENSKLKLLNKKNRDSVQSIKMKNYYLKGKIQHSLLLNKSKSLINSRNLQKFNTVKRRNPGKAKLVKLVVLKRGNLNKIIVILWIPLKRISLLMNSRISMNRTDP